MLDLNAQYTPMCEEIRAAMDRVTNAQYFTGGPEVEALEREIAAYNQCPFGTGVSSVTDALIAALMAIGIRPGGEVITAPYSLFAIYNQFVIRTGCRDAVITSLKECKIGYKIYYPVPLHLQECFADLSYRAGVFPHSEAAG